MISPGEKILVIGSEPKESRHGLRALGHAVVEVENEAEAVDKLRADEAITIVVFSLAAVADPRSFISKLNDVERQGLVILGEGAAEQRDEFRRLDIRLFLAAPWAADTLLSFVRARRLTMGLMNLHDAFLNASMVKRLMDSSPIVGKEAEVFMASDRGRAERLWVGLLAVLVEAWEAGRMRPVRDYVQSVTDTSTLVRLLREARKKRKKEDMFEVRHYMFHRDERSYWDVGRLAVVGQLDVYKNLHNEFSKVLLAAMQAWTNERGAGVGP